MNILLITIDACRQDAISFFNRSTPTTPTIDYLARNGLSFSNAFVTFGGTPESVPSIMHSVWCKDHHCFPVGYDYKHPISCDAPSISEVLQEKGYSTVATTAIHLLDEELGFTRGFDKFQCKPWAPAYTANSILISQLKEVPRPWFGWIHYCDPHAVYRSVKRFEGLTKNPYLQNVLEVDDAISRLLDEVDADVVIVTADHGESFGEHGVYFHGNLYEEALRVPLVIYNRAKVLRKEITSNVRSIDIVPTILEMVGEDRPSSWVGKSLLDVDGNRLLFCGDEAPDGHVFAAYRTDKFKYIYDTYGPAKSREFVGVDPSYDTEHLYDLDLGEHLNLLGDLVPHTLGEGRVVPTSRAFPNLDYEKYNRIKREMKARLFEHLGEGRSTASQELTAEESKEITSHLKDLGYL